MIGLAAVAMGAEAARAPITRSIPWSASRSSPRRATAVDRGSPLAILHVRDAKDVEAVRARVSGAFTIEGRARPERPLVLGAIR